jgi:excisionase family DNA binding protein
MSDLLSLHQLAAQLRLPRRWLRQEARAGRLPHLRTGRKLLFHRPTVEGALARRAAGEVAHAG